MDCNCYNRTATATTGLQLPQQDCNCYNKTATATTTDCNCYNRAANATTIATATTTTATTLLQHTIEDDGLVGAVSDGGLPVETDGSILLIAVGGGPTEVDRKPPHCTVNLISVG